MWETLISHPLGRLSTRKYLHVAIALLVACFAYIIAFPTDTYALDAEFNGSTLEYNNQPFSGPLTATGTNPPGVPKDAKFYSSQDQTNPGKGILIYFKAGTDPQKASTAYLRTGDYDVATGRFSNLSPPTSIAVTHSAPGTSDEPETSCAIDGVGWIVCSMSRWIAEGVDYLYGVLTNFFVFEPLTSSGNTSSIYQLWGTVRNIANILFIAGFIVVIYGQMTSFFISNYTIKKILPRIVVAAILVNTSYWICAIGIDLSNFLGVQIQNIFVDMRNSLGAAIYPDLPNWQEVTTGILSGGGIVIGGGLLLTATGGTVGGLAFLLLGALLPVIFAVLVAVTVLAARQALITILVIVAPLAFVAYLLPNTEEWFTRWRKFFMTLLIMFPAFSLIFGGAQLAGVIIIQNARDISVALLGLTVQVVPLFITPFLIKLSSGVLGTIAGLTNNKSKGVFDRAKNWTDTERERQRQRGFSKRPNRRLEAARPTAWARRMNQGRLRREGMTAAYKSVAEARFADTRGGRAVHERRKRGEAYQHAAGAANDYRWSQTMDRSEYLKGIHTDAHRNAGLAKISENEHNAHAEKAFRNHVINTPALQQRITQTTIDTNKAKQAEDLVQDTANVAWENLTLNDRSVYSRNLERQGLNKQIKAAQDEWEAILAEASAGFSNDYNRKFGPVTLPVHTAISQITDAEVKIAAESLRKAQAETKQHKDLTDNLLKNATQIDGVAIRDYAGGVRGVDGAETVLASAIARSRKEYGERIGEKAELVKHFNLSSAQRQELAMGQHNITVTDSSGATYTFNTADDYLREAVIDKQLKAGSFGDIRAIIDASTAGGDTHAYRTSIADAIVQNGLDNKAFFWGSKSIDDVAQGNYSETKALAYHLLGDKVKAEKLAVQDAYSMRKAFEFAHNPRAMALISPADRAKFDDNYRAMRQAADRILSTPELSKSLNREAREILEHYRLPQ
jgi:hypothetical protein